MTYMSSGSEECESQHSCDFIFISLRKRLELWVWPVSVTY